MLCFIGLRVTQPLSHHQKYKDALTEIRHYLSLRPAIQLNESDYLLSLAQGNYNLELVKNPCYLHSCHFSVPLLHQEDFQFLDTCYEALMILQEAFPSKVTLEILSDSDSPELQAFQQRKKEELSRRLNTSLKVLADTRTELSNDDLEDILFLAEHTYSRKNKAVALRLLTNRISIQSLGAFGAQYLEVVERLQQDPELKRLAIELAARIKGLQREGLVAKENSLQESNVSHQEADIKPSSLLFQLRQSYNLERICGLLSHALNRQAEKDLMAKLETAAVLVADRFISDEYQEVGSHGPHLAELLNAFWHQRGKNWDPSVRQEVERKANEGGCANSRHFSNKSKLPFSRRVPN